MILPYLFAATLVWTCFGEESVFITVTNARQLRANDDPIFQCYRTRGETISRTYGRYVDTRNGVQRNQPPNSPIGHCCISEAQRIYLPTDRDNGFGIFYSRATQPNKTVTTVPTILLRNDAKLHPKGGFFTKTVNIGDENVILEVERANGDQTDVLVQNLYWRFNNSYEYNINSFSLVISSPVSKDNEGAYEAHYADDRNTGRHAIMRLIVRACPANRWGPPNCNGVCDKCYNGGVCDDKSGLCICPPGFRGENCLTACGGNRFGKTCEFQCSSGRPRPEACINAIICLPDPYGCTCNTGFHMLECVNACPAGKFGAGCTQDCHCTTSCNQYTGACAGSCTNGWSGGSCQIPDVCDADYYGPQCTLKCHCENGAALCDKNTGECPGRRCALGFNVYNDGPTCQECRGSTFGRECSGVCRCDVLNCDKETGDCDGGCLSNWVQPDCQTGIESLTNTKVNPNQKTVFSCRVTGNPMPTKEVVILERLGGRTEGITFKSTSTDGDIRSVLFDVNSVAFHENITCRLMIGQGAWAYIEAITFVLPQLNSPPRVTCIGNLSANIEWDAWINNTNIGDPPVIAYRVHYRRRDSTSWTSLDINDQDLRATITDLRWETDYVFSISAVREGTGGEGLRGPSSPIATTACAGASLDVTVFNRIPLLRYTPADDVDTFFGGFKSGSDIDATISLGRAVNTGTGGDWPPYPPGSRLDPQALSGRAYRIMLTASGGIERIGAFYVDAEKGSLMHRIVTITMAYNAGVFPESQTKTVNIGENVTLTMTPVTQPTLLEWRFNSEVRSEWEGMSTVQISNVTKQHEGVYECYDTNQRLQGRQGIMRLIVRDCPDLRWNPPTCDQECLVCYNGGVCDGQTGLCVCPPGFGGTNCEDVFGRNQWGNDGGHTCSRSGGTHGSNCKGRLFCRPDPYGCSCIAGYKGLDCKTDCEASTFGAGCIQECHCEGNACLLDSGECTSNVNCMPGWRGVNCQVPDPCPVGYYGSLCTQRCRCSNNMTCDEGTGFCENGCEIGYIGYSCVSDGSPTLVSFASQQKVNSGDTTVLECTIYGNPLPSATMVTVTNSMGARLTLTDTETFDRLYTRKLRYNVTVFTSGEVFLCSLSPPGEPTMSTRFRVTVFTPPVLINAPTIRNENITANSVTVRWVSWHTSMGGDGPVSKYIVKYRESTADATAAYTSSVLAGPGESMTVVDGLNWDTEYDFVVVAAREGARGEGPPSPKTTAKTKCDATIEDHLERALGALDSTRYQQQDEYSAFGNFVGTALRGMESRQAFKAKLEIMDIIYRNKFPETE